MNQEGYIQPTAIIVKYKTVVMKCRVGVKLRDVVTGIAIITAGRKLPPRPGIVKKFQ